MVNTYAKGNRVEKLARKLFEDRGWITWKPSRAKFNSNDAFGLFDFIAVKETKVIFAQVKSQASHFYSSRKEIAKWLEDHKLLTYCLCILYEGNNEWRKEWYDVIEHKWEKYNLTNE